jgi:hypothetical protein
MVATKASHKTSGVGRRTGGTRRAKGRERRTDPRLRLCYPIEVRPGDGPEVSVTSRTVTQDLSARGAYFCTSMPEDCQVGRTVEIVVTVPHRLAADGSEVSIDLRGHARIVRVDLPARGSAGEDGVVLAGVALEFERPLDFSYSWV